MPRGKLDYTYTDTLMDALKGVRAVYTGTATIVDSKVRTQLGYHRGTPEEIKEFSLAKLEEQLDKSIEQLYKSMKQPPQLSTLEKEESGTIYVETLIHENKEETYTMYTSIKKQGCSYIFTTPVSFE